MFSQEITAKSLLLSKLLRGKGYKMATAESCTGGLISACMTELPGSSEVFERGFVSYSNESKVDLLTVPTFYIEDYGAVSAQTAVAMAEGALLMSRADVSVAVTGIAGPDGGTSEKPVGTVFIACSSRNGESIYRQFHFEGSRNTVRIMSTINALDMVAERLGVGE